MSVAAPRCLLDEAEIAALVRRLGLEISADHPNGVVLVGVLKGAAIFLADLLRTIEVPVAVDFIALSRFAPDSGRVRILQDLQIDVTGGDIVIVEGLVDTGLTLDYLLRALKARSPRRLSVCALLDRTLRRIVPNEISYSGIEVGEGYLLGYGFHHRELYRNLSSIYEGRRDAVAADPACYVPMLYPKPTVAQTEIESPVVGSLRKEES